MPLAGKPPERAYRADIDGLRALAILSVAAYHGGLPWLTGGLTGVDIFFVISGYLIGGQIYAEIRNGTFSYLHFYRRRAKRILPAFLAVVAFTMLAAMFLLSPYETRLLCREAIAATLSGSNVLFWWSANYFAGKSELDPLLMTWSLGVEEQFYAVIPLLIVLLARLRRNWILPAIAAGCVLSLAFAWSALANYPMLVFYMLPARAWELGAGVALAVAEVNRRGVVMPARLAQAAGWTGLLLMLAPMAAITPLTAFPGPGALPSVAGAALVIASPGSWVNRRLLSLAPLQFIGKISYSWYLWHWPLLALMYILYDVTLPPVVAALTIAASFGAAVLSYYFIEQPFRRSRRPPVPLLLRYAALCATMLVVCGALRISKGMPQRFPALARMEATGQLSRADPCLAGTERDEPNLKPGCYDTSDASASVALWGDSHAAALAPALRSQAGTQGYGFAMLGKASCPPLSGATHYVPRVPQLAAECWRFNRHVLDRLEADRRVRIVILTAVWAAPLYRTWTDGWLTADLAHAGETPTSEASRRLFVDSLEASIRELQAAGKQVIVLEDVPAFVTDPLWRFNTQRIPARRRLAAWLEVPNATDPGVAPPDNDPNVAVSISLLQEAVAGFKDVELVDLKPALCNGLCAYRDGEKLLYSDSSHLSLTGAIFALRNFRLPALVEAGK